MGPISFSGVIDITDWTPPGKDCGACGAKTCLEFVNMRMDGNKSNEECPFFPGTDTVLPPDINEAIIGDTDLLGNDFDFIIHPLPGEPSARKIILPFRPDLVERWEIKKGDIVLGRPMGAGCPVQHVLSVIHADPITGVLTCHVVSPMIARSEPEMIKDVRAYHIIGFEGLTEVIAGSPEFGRRQRFLPGFCMMNLAHTGVVNMVLQKEAGTQIRVEDIRII